MRVLAIDPGSTESAFVEVDEAGTPLAFDKVPNGEVLDLLVSPRDEAWDAVAIEMVASYGMPVGAEVFDTCVWAGRFAQALVGAHAFEADFIKRQPVKLHHCHSPRANDATVRQALVDRFAYGQRNGGKGTKAEPGFFYGFRADIWQAQALAIYVLDNLLDGQVGT